MIKPVDLVIFGGAGDLAQRKLLPALYRATKEGSLDPQTRIFATVRKEADVEGFVAKAEASLNTFLAKEEVEKEAMATFLPMICPICIDISNPELGWPELKKQLAQTPDRDRVYYMAIAPALFEPACGNLSRHGLITDNSRVVLEKPLGYDRESANAINSQIAEYFQEQQIYRIDHYLGKETVQNLLALRFSNFMFESFWDAKSIDHVQISISETVGVEGRAGFYDQAGAMRDMIQNHILQLLCLIAMEPPHKISGEGIRREKLKVLEALRPIVGEQVDRDTVRGQYQAGAVNGAVVPGYLEELGEPSHTETFVAIRAHIDNWRWGGVPFYLRTGKRMQKRCAEIIIQYKPVSHTIYGEEAGPMTPNRLLIRLQPDEGIQLTLMTKKLDQQEMRLQPVKLDMQFADSHQDYVSDAYKRLLLDAAAGNPSLFIHRDEVDLAWSWVDPIIERWNKTHERPHGYMAGSWGPEAAYELLARDKNRWFNALADE